MESQIVTLILILAFIIVIIALALKAVMPLLENIYENKHEYKMTKLEKGLEGGLDNNQISKELEKHDNSIVMANQRINTLTNRNVELFTDKENTNTTLSFLKSETESVLERLEKIETLVDNLKHERDIREEENDIEEIIAAVKQRLGIGEWITQPTEDNNISKDIKEEF